MTRRDPATENQVRAAAPEESTWLSANAGSGKTKVLTDRVARLLLGGTEPQRVLCLTYTKAAAAEMQNRLLKRLGAWAMMEDAPLRAELRALGEEGAFDAEHLARARRLFAQAIEAPGGLKIQTIHSFCGALLRRFPLEAGVPHGFAELDDRSAALLREEVLETIASGAEQPAFDALARHFSGEDFSRLIAEISRHRDAFLSVITVEDLHRAIGLPADLTLRDLPGRVLDSEAWALIDQACPILAQQSPTMKTMAQVLRNLDRRTPGEADLRALYDLFLYRKDGAPLASAKASSLTKGAVAALGEELTEALRGFAERVAEARGAEFALSTIERTLALHAFARAFLPLFAQRKAERGWLDFDDLITRAGALLSDPSVAQWVLFRLDGGIDHILVDEAQDTSPEQWHVIERLADEFTAGDGARETRRTIFIVGDRKQSIYSFQGADLSRFEAMQRLFSEKFAAISRPLQNTALLHSFRSSYAILRLVDLTFSGAQATGLGGAPEHLAFHETMPGRVDLWPVVPPPAKPAEDDWENPVDLPGEDDANVVLARGIAQEIRAMIDAGTALPTAQGPRPVHEGDFLILVRRRGTLFVEIIRACKAAGLAVAGADRLKLGAELAVRDIVSVLAFLATPEDDLSLAEALRSPLFGWSEDALYRLAQPRRGYLWQALRSDETTDAATREILRDLLDQADFLRPYDLIERLLGRHGGRERLLARLGPEAEDGIDELVTQAIAYEQGEVPSLTGFLNWLGADDVEVKRQLEGGGRSIRLMTVHGAKGLEAPIVILPDTTKPRNTQSNSILRGENHSAFWKGPSASLPPALRDAADEELHQIEEERRRLLYVALTRAEKWLIVAAAGEVKADDGSWYATIEQGMEQAGTETVSALSDEISALGPVRRFSHGDWPEPVSAQAVETAPRVTLPDWAFRRAAAPSRATAALSPSDLGGAKALPGESDALDEEAAKRRGRQLHLLLEHLPQWPAETWPDLASDLLSSGDDRADSAETETILADATRVLRSVDAAGFLGPDSLAEVEITAELSELDGQRIHGVIDRLQVTGNTVRVLDYKSNTVVPAHARAVPLGLQRQMAAYRAALRQIYPGRSVECALLWTVTGEIMPLSSAQLDAALRSAPAS
ncbi:MAG: double-strand break repair helicase AddA [Paenirhodobacter sp.]|uniref:double-strand break repair helicase AddA n=1 Tax=Paenirhodobacter sp. TaxID=1965326 RepID=UPI003D0DA44E